MLRILAHLVHHVAVDEFDPAGVFQRPDAMIRSYSLTVIRWSGGDATGAGDDTVGRVAVAVDMGSAPSVSGIGPRFLSALTAILFDLCAARKSVRAVRTTATQAACSGRSCPWICLAAFRIACSAVVSEAFFHRTVTEQSPRSIVIGSGRRSAPAGGP